MRLRVSSIDQSLNKDKLQELFEEYGDVQSIKVFRSLDSASPSLAIVDMRRDAAAEAALKALDGEVIGNTPLRVEISQDMVRHNPNRPKPPVLDDEDEDEADSATIDEDEPAWEGEEEDEAEENVEVPLDEIEEEL